jgi:hypothetical protein
VTAAEKIVDGIGDYHILVLLVKGGQSYGKRSEDFRGNKRTEQKDNGVYGSAEPEYQ